MRANEFILDEDWKKVATGAALAGGLALAGHHLLPKDVAPIKEPATTVNMVPQIPQVDKHTLKQMQVGLQNFNGIVLQDTAKQAGLKGNELAQFLAQCAHESYNFSNLKELGKHKHFKQYDPKFAPVKAKLLGNTNSGDGQRYLGRGYIQLTGRENYRKAGEAIGLPLEKDPHLAEDPEVAAKIAVWYWKKRVSPKIKDFDDTTAVTRHINSELNGLADRDNKYNAIRQIFMLGDK